ncbi:excinuclease ABC subunit UvrB [bacterium]|nr:excinuclease ABC subunit UvrB [bacterium]
MPWLPLDKHEPHGHSSFEIEDGEAGGDDGDSLTVNWEREGEFKLVSEFSPGGDQPQAIDRLVDGLSAGLKHQTLLGATGTGKTFTLANVIQRVQKPTLVISHNKTLAAQLCAEFRAFFPENHVEYFVSYYDYYQPEAYIPKTDTYIEKDSAINEEIDRLRHSATEALLTRRDVLVVASVSCIFGLGSPEDYEKLSLRLYPGFSVKRERLIRRLVDMQYMRNLYELKRGTFRVKGDVFEIYAADKEEITRLEFFGNDLEAIAIVDPVTGEELARPSQVMIFPASHYLVLPDKQSLALKSIRKELQDQLSKFEADGKLLEHQRLKERVKYDLEMIENVGYCSGIENYSRHFDGRLPGETPSNLIEYFPDDFLMIIDESHVTLPQLRGMYNGDKSRKQTLVDYGFRLPSALDNRPLRFEEWERYVNQAVYMSATPGPYELEHSERVVEQIIRPTGLLDPQIVIQPTRHQIDDLTERIQERIRRSERTLVTTLTKRMAENLADYLAQTGVKTQYLHSDVDTVERIRILKDLRLGTYDVVVGINLLREGLDLPEVSLIGILDADKEGFLRSDKSLIQIIGRAARNVGGEVVLYADRITDSMRRAIDETNRRREKQVAYNDEHGITPKTIVKKIQDLTDGLEEQGLKVIRQRGKEGEPDEFDRMSIAELSLFIAELEAQMLKWAELLEFEKAAVVRDQVDELNKKLKRKLKAEHVGTRGVVG